MTREKRLAIEKIVSVFMLAYGINYFGYYFRNRFLRWLNGFHLDEGLFHVLFYMGHLIFLTVFIIYALAVKGDRKYFLAPFRKCTSSNLLSILVGGVYGFSAMGICIFAASFHGDIVITRLPQINVPLIVFAVFAVFLQASIEEIESRGFVFGKMYEEGVPLALAVLFSSLFFAFIHAANPGFGLVPFISIVVIGAQFALIYHYFGNIWFTCASHMMWNFTQDFIFGLPDSGNKAAVSIFDTKINGSSFFYDATFGIEGSYMAITVNALLCIAVIAVGRATQKKRAE